MSWMEELKSRLMRSNLFQMSIDGQIWTVDARDGRITFTNEFGRKEEFASQSALIDSIQSWYEQPDIIVL